MVCILCELYTPMDNQLVRKLGCIILDNYYLHMKNTFCEISKGNKQYNDQIYKIKSQNKNVVRICTITKNVGILARIKL